MFLKVEINGIYTKFIVVMRIFRGKVINRHENLPTCLPTWWMFFREWLRSGFCRLKTQC